MTESRSASESAHLQQITLLLLFVNRRLSTLFFENGSGELCLDR